MDIDFPVSFSAYESYLLSLLNDYFSTEDNRYFHILGVVSTIKDLCIMNGYDSESDFYRYCVTVAYLHDIGYSNSINVYDFHAYDGYCFIQNHLYVDNVVFYNDFEKDLISLVISYHTYSDILIELDRFHFNNLNTDLFDIYESLNIDKNYFGKLFNKLLLFISYADMNVKGDGTIVNLDERVTDICERYGSDSLQGLHALEVLDLLKSSNLHKIVKNGGIKYEY